MGRDGRSVVEKVSRVLECYIQEGAFALGFAELLEPSDLSRASLHRTLREMVENGLLAQTGQREEYRLGPLLRSTAALSAAVATVPALAWPHMERLRDECGETVVLAELHGTHVVPVKRADGLHEMRMNQEVGRRYPAHAGATGKVLLAQLEPKQLAASLGDGELEALTPATVTDRRRLATDLERIRAAGVGVTLGERVPEAVAISAAVLDAGGRVAAALTISGIASRYTRERLVTDALAVHRVAAVISADAGCRRLPERDLDDVRGDARRALEEMCDAAWAAGGREPLPA
jgi:DNA-binding IclR family transcriptional regulator